MFAVALLVARWLPRGVSGIVGFEGTGDGPAPGAFVVSLIILGVMLGACTLAAVALGAVNLRDSFRVAEPTERRRMLWVVGGFSAASWMLVAAFGLVLLMVISGLDIDMLIVAVLLAIVLSPLVVVVSAATGVLYSGAIDPALALRRSTLYGVLGALGVVTFAAVENALSDFVEQRLALPGFVGAALAGGLVAALLIPLRSLLRRAILERSGTQPDQRH